MSAPHGSGGKRPPPTSPPLVIPAIDLAGGKCVRLVQGDLARRTVYADDPVAQARIWRDQGAPRLHVVDLDGAFAGAPRHLETILAIRAAVDVPLQVGGGIRDRAGARSLLDRGVEFVILGTAAVADPELVRHLAAEAPGRVLVGVDVRAGQVAVEGWAKTSARSGEELLRELAALPLAGVVYTDISRDGMLAGPNLEALSRAVRAAAPLLVIASGGIASVEDVRRLREAGVAGMVIGKALYTGALRLPELLQRE